MKKASLFLSALVLALSLFAGSASASADTALESEVDALIGTAYLYGGTTTSGFDCSGFTQYVFKQLDLTLSRTSGSQSKEGTEVSKSNLRQGDLVFFNTSGKGISHVGVYLEDGKFAHSSTSKGVIISELSEKYYASRYVTARRVLDETQYQNVATVVQSEQVAVASAN